MQLSFRIIYFYTLYNREVKKCMTIIISCHIFATQIILVLFVFLLDLYAFKVYLIYLIFMLVSFKSTYNDKVII